VFVQLDRDRDHVEMLLYFARIGEKATSSRSWRHGFRRQACCSGHEREPDCVSCQHSPLSERCSERAARGCDRAEPLMGSLDVTYKR
jgi:hypothetical protein